MEASLQTKSSDQPNSGDLKASIWGRLIDVLAQFDSPATKYYLEKCNALVERLITNVKPLPTGADLVGSIQNELHIPTSASELPTTGVLGLCVNLITIVCQEEEDPIELILSSLSDGGVDSICFPGTYERESKRQTERHSSPHDVSVHRFQLRVPGPPSNQMSALQLIKELQLQIANEAIVSPKRLVAVVVLSNS
jgi:hypothetical protein